MEIAESKTTPVQMVFSMGLELVLRPDPVTQMYLDGKAELILGADPFPDNVLELQRELVVDSVRKCFRTNEVDCHESAFEYLEEKDYSKWIVENDPSIVDGNDTYGIEVIAPRLSTADEWIPQIQDVFSALKIQDLEIVTVSTNRCSTHVHLSPKGGFDTESLRRLAKGIVLFRENIYEEVPLAARQINMKYARQNPLPKDILNLLNESTDKGQIVAHMMPLHAGDIDPRYQAWNFLLVLDPNQGSVEFRQPPHVTDSEGAVHWISFAVNFAAWCLHGDLNHAIDPDNEIGSDEELDLARPWAPNGLSPVFHLARTLTSLRRRTDLIVAS